MALRRVGGAALVAASLYATASAASDMVLLRVCERLVLERARQHGRLLEELGEPLRPGPWHNASVKVHPGGGLATVVFPLQGSRSTSDATVRVARRGGLALVELHNLVGSAEWEPLVMDVLVGRSGRAAASISLLEAEAPRASGSRPPRLTHAHPASSSGGGTAPG